MADHQQIAHKVREIIADHLGLSEEEITLESSLSADLGVDSLDLVELFLSLEEEFGNDIPEEVADAFETVQNIVDYLQSLSNE